MIVATLLVLGDADATKVEIELLGNATFVEEVFTVEDDDVGSFVAIFRLHEYVTMTETARYGAVDKNRLFLLFHELFMKVEVIRL